LAFIVDLSERENDFILSVLNHVEEDPTKLIERGELYALAKANGFSEREVYRYVMNFDLLGYLKAQPILGGKIASLKLTTQGLDYARELRDQQEPL
jgi:Zn-dependent M28 family amino/carboxypeptidase